MLELRENQQLEKKINLKMDLFCKFYATDPQCYGNATEVYAKVYKSKNYQVAQMGGSRLLTDPRITARINEYLSQEGFNDVNVDKQHNFIINQFKDLNVKMKGIEHYNRLKKRVDNKLEIVIPRPLMALDDDEVIHKIDKSKAKEVPKEG